MTELLDPWFVYEDEPLIPDCEVNGCTCTEEPAPDCGSHFP